jgi:hypothetical protein
MECTMSHKSEKRLALTRVEQAQLTSAWENQGDVLLAQQVGVARQTLARAVAGMKLNTVSREALQTYLANASHAA